MQEDSSALGVSNELMKVGVRLAKARFTVTGGEVDI
jgi:hypothetical protein